jgi:two-component system, OmpR family, alkaline phosphatase synthesis response regulator PhoP
MKHEKILVVEDEADIRDLIHFNLFKEKYVVELAPDGFSAIDIFNEFSPDLVLLDLMLPGKSGHELCKEMKSLKPSCMVVMVTARGEEEDVVKGFEMGADDYISKPFSPKVLVARVKAILRRINGVQLIKLDDDILEYEHFRLDMGKRKFFLCGKELELTFSEFQIFELFLSKPGQVFTRSKIVDLVRGENHAISDRSVDVQIVGLRKKLDDSGKFIETVRGVGYRLKDDGYQEL